MKSPPCCILCRTPFEPHQLARKRRFCSRACANQYANNERKKDRVPIICNCGKEFFVKRCKSQTAKYCSLSCKNKFHDQSYRTAPDVTKYCRICNDPFTIKQGRAKSRNYCNDCDGRINSGGVIRGALHKWFKSGKTEQRFGYNWPQRRKEARERDSNICKVCGKVGIIRGLDVHHIRPRSEYKDVGAIERYGNSLSNLITLCRSCHIKSEQGLISRRFLKVLINC